jgi:hypothetical protein
MRSLSDFTAMLGSGSEAQTPQDDLVLPDSEPAKPKTAGTGGAGGTKSRPQSSIQQLTQAYPTSTVRSAVSTKNPVKTLKRKP